MLDFLFFFHPDASRFYHLAQIGMNRGRNRDCVTGALHFYITINHYNILLKTSFATVIGTAQPTSPNGANIKDDVATSLDILSKGLINQVKNVSQTIKLHRQIHLQKGKVTCSILMDIAPNSPTRVASGGITKPSILEHVQKRKWHIMRETDLCSYKCPC